MKYLSNLKNVLVDNTINSFTVTLNQIKYPVCRMAFACIFRVKFGNGNENP